MEQAQTKNIVIDGKEYAVDNFSQQVRGMINLRDVWNQEANEERAKLTKTEAAMRQLDNELLEVINAELKAQAELAEEQEQMEAERQANMEAAKPVVKKTPARKPVKKK